MPESLRDTWTGRLSCPFCHAEHPAECEHFIGWTSDGRTIEPRVPGRKLVADNAVLDTDRCINTGVSTRVYRDWVFA